MAAQKSVRDRAVCFLMASSLDLAIRDLEQVLEAEPGAAEVLSDLSALYAERARIENKPADYIRALASVEDAVELDPHLPEALFNRALSLQRLFLPDEARVAWLRYLELDIDSPWAHEARAHLRQLPSTRRPPDYDHLIMESIEKGDVDSVVKLARSSPESARVVFERELLFGWVDDIASDRQEHAKRKVRAANHIAAILSLQGDRLHSRIVREMEDVNRLDAWRQKRSPLVKSLQHLRIAREMTEADSKRCMREFVLATQGLRAIRSSLILQAQLWEAACSDSARARELYDELGTHPLLAEYKSLRVRRLEILGKYEESSGDLTAAIATHQIAIELCRSRFDKSMAVRLANHIAKNLESVGRDDEAWIYRLQALNWSRHVRFRGQLVPAVLGSSIMAARAALAQRHLDVALRFQNQYVKDADRFDILFPRLYGRLARARISLAIGNIKEAKRDLEFVVDTLELIPLEDRPDLAAEIEVVSSRIQESDDRAAAIIDDMHLSYQDTMEPSFRDARADMLFREGQTVAAESELVRALEELERRREMIGSLKDRASFLDRERALYERMIAFQLNLGRPEKALEFLERFRARTLLDQLQEITSQDALISASEARAIPLSPQEIVRRMPERTVVVIYAVAGSRLGTWLVRSSGIKALRSRTSWTTIAESVQRLHQARGSDPLMMRPVLRDLHSALIAPWRAELNAGDRIVFIPALELFHVPFSALLDSRSQRFLMQDHAIGIAPSVAQFMSALKRDQGASGKPLDRVLLVGNPSRGSSSPSLPPLPSSSREIEEIRDIYHDLSPEVLLHQDATSTRISTALGRSDMAHFAVHAVMEKAEPANSHLVLSQLDDVPDHLYAHDVVKLHLSRMRLVILSACETQAGRISVSEGSLSLAAAFLAAGVPAVVGTLWTVEDRAAARLSVRFHKHLRQGVDALSALRAAQLEELASEKGNSDLSWAGFQVVGGVAARATGGEGRKPPQATSKRVVPEREVVGPRSKPQD